jgi:tetratricopeptide (TPR) repeat protein
MTAYRGSGQGPFAPLLRFAALLVALAGAFVATAAPAQEKAQLIVTREKGFARLVLSFPDRLDLPPYKLRYENGVLAVEFESPINLLLPDVSVTLPEYVSVARVDPDKRGVRFGLRTAFNVNRIEAGEKLFVDLMPTSWQGLPPALPASIIAELAERSKRAAEIAEQKRKAEDAKNLHPKAIVRVGRNPTFLRVQFDWSVDTEAKFAVREDKAILTFDWPVPIDLYALKSDLPPELISAANVASADGSRVDFKVAEGVVPRFYAISDRQFVVDIDIAREAGLAAAIAAEEAVERLREEAEKAMREAAAAEAAAAAESGGPGGTEPSGSRELIPTVSMIGGTVRLTFPFSQDTAAAVFRRGDTVWMLFDTLVPIGKPAQSDALDAIARGFEVIPAGGTKVVRLDLSDERLATLGSEGRSWVLSLGDVLLDATEPVTLSRHRDEEGRLEMVADLQRAAKVHDFRDPVVGDMLKVVTAFPPARGVSRTLTYVDFTILRSVHGLAVKAENEALEIALEEKNAVLRAADGLALSALENVRRLDSGNAPEFRASYIDLATIREDDPIELVGRRESLINRAAQAEGRLRDVARMDLAQYYIANGFAHEAIGVLKVIDAELEADDLRRKVRLTRGIADTLAYRPLEALAIFNADSFSDEVDALMWRSMAKGQLNDYVGARTDAIAAESVVEAYPNWIRTRFLLSAIRAAIETKDLALALRYFDMIDFAKLEPEQVSTYQVLQARVAEAENRVEEALDIYGEVISADIRPTRAEAVYRTLLLLDRTDRIDLAKATETLSAEVLLWRGNALEADMQKLLAELYFRNRDYRRGFETVKQAVAYYPENKTITELLGEAQEVFTELYLNGRADQLEPVDALALYYDFRQLTPPGVRGDEMIRNLARRLVKVDLLAQAADLLEYQIDSRLQGIAQAQIAADLAIIRIADRDPEGALRVLNRTRLADLSPMLERQRRILEARALIDAGRQDLALDLLGRVTGRDADLLRVEGYWRSKNYGVAAELLEVMYQPGPGGDPLSQGSRMNLIKAAVGFVLSGDKLGLSRLRSKFGEQLSTTAEWAMFDFVTGDVMPSSIEFKKVAREVSGLDSLNAFIESYREMYAVNDPMTPRKAAPATEA